MKKVRLPRLPRWGKILRNLALALLLLGAVWGAMGFPILTKYGEYQRLLKENLLETDRLVYRLDQPGYASAFLTQGEDWFTVGRVTQIDGGGSPVTNYYGVITNVLPLDQLNVVLLPLGLEDDSAVAAVAGAPAEAVSGQLELILEGVERPWSYPESWFEELGAAVPEREVFTARADRREDGWFFFTLAAHPEENICALEAMWENLIFSYGPASWPVRLTLWDEAGNEVLQWEGALPECQNLVS